MNKVYRYKLDYRDFLKMYVGDLTQIQKYLFLQTQPIEIELYLEQLILSVNNKIFPELELKELAEKYPQTITELLKKINQDDLTLENKEFLKVRLNADSDFLDLMVKAYMKIIEISLDIQKRMLLNIDKKYTPITIITNSVILNRLGTSINQFISEEKIPRKQTFSLEAKNFQEIQIRDLNVKMLAVTDESYNLIHKSLENSREFEIFYELYKTRAKEMVDKTKSDQYLNALINMSLYSDILDKNKNFKKVKGKMNELYLPYFDSPTRKIEADWSYGSINYPKDNKN